MSKYFAVFCPKGEIQTHTIKPTEYEAGDSYSDDYYFDHFEKKGYTISEITVTKTNNHEPRNNKGGRR